MSTKNTPCREIDGRGYIFEKTLKELEHINTAQNWAECSENIPILAEVLDKLPPECFY
jgi:hypothetical protein|tara:strand:- start:1558 stop:1731 length:174 start_codon:yes stop_codon:yes gene_type:complete